jgi:Ni/Fe-hydrogenase subunit HybB-like protein
MSNISATTGPGYAIRPGTKAPNWHGLVAVDLLFNSLTTGLFLVAALAELAAPGVFTPVAKVAYPAAFVLLIADLLCLVLDLGDPLRFHYMLRVFKPTSPMSLGTWCLTSYSIPLTVAAALGIVTDGTATFEWTRKVALLVGFLPALGAATYKGVLFSTTAQPGWKDARWLGSYLTSSAPLLGCAAMLVLSILTEQARATTILCLALKLLIVLNAVPLVLTCASLRSALAQKYSLGQMRGLGALALGGGVLIPLWLLLAGEGPLSLWGAVLALLLASLLIRFVIVHVPHRLP